MRQIEKCHEQTCLRITFFICMQNFRNVYAIIKKLTNSEYGPLNKRFLFLLAETAATSAT